jgi:hypothetical protein
MCGGVLGSSRPMVRRWQQRFVEVCTAASETGGL